MADLSQLSDSQLDAMIAQAQGSNSATAPAATPVQPSAAQTLSPVEAIHQIESGGASDSRADIVNAASGAQGSMQVLPTTAKDPGFGITPSDGTPQDNARVGQQYFSKLQDKYGDPSIAAAAYNWGTGNVDKWLKSGGDLSKLPTETLNYLIKFQQLTGTGQQPTQSQSAPGGDLGFTPMDQFNKTVQPVQQSGVMGATQPTQQGANWGASLSNAIAHPLDAAKSLAGGVGQGFGNVVLGAEGLAGKGLSAIGLDSAGQALQSDSATGVKNLQQQAGALPNQGATKVGDVVGAAAPAMFVPGSLAAQVGANAGIGAASAQADGASPLVGAALGGVGGASGVGLSKAIGGIVGGAGGQDIQQLRGIGVAPTLGQTLGGIANAFEQRATSVPLFGDAINAGRSGAVNQFNKGITNDALAPIGQSLDDAIPAGNEAIAAATNKLSSAYNDLLPHAVFAADAPFMQGVQQARQGLLATGAPAPIIDRFDNVVTDQLLNRTNNGFATGTIFKTGESNLTSTAKNLAGDTNADNRALGGALKQVLAASRDSLERNSPPQVGQQLQQINQAYAKFKTVEAAAGSAAGGQTDGLFTPAAYNRQVKMNATQGQRARGQAFNQSLAGAAVNRLGNSVPDSGTAGRLAQGAGLGALGATAVANPVAAVGYAAGAGLTHLLYSETGRKVLAKALIDRPDLLRQIGESLNKTAPTAGGLLGALSTNTLNNQ